MRNRLWITAATLFAGLALGACSGELEVVESNAAMNKTPNQAAAKNAPQPGAKPATPDSTKPATEVATFGAGCFWCVEAVLEQLDGIASVESGYMGGKVDNPTYQQVCTGLTGHAEVVHVEFDPAKISYKTLLKWFFKLHDPTTLNRQGNDAGTQYRSVIFYHSDEQKTLAERAKRLVDAGEVFPDPVVTEISKATKFFPAELYHQDYYRQNKSQGYCRAIIAPKLDKLGLEK